MNRRSPLSVLAAILFIVAWNMSEVGHFVHILRTAPRADRVILAITFLLTVFVDLVVAVNVGVILAVLLFMRRVASTVEVERIEGLYRTMARIRAFEDAAEAASQGGVSAYGKSADGRAKVRGPLHLSTGQEAVAVAAGELALQLGQRRSVGLEARHRGHAGLHQR